jgi:hypothetical protein
MNLMRGIGNFLFHGECANSMHEHTSCLTVIAAFRIKFTKFCNVFFRRRFDGRACGWRRVMSGQPRVSTLGLFERAEE